MEMPTPCPLCHESVELHDMNACIECDNLFCSECLPTNNARCSNCKIKCEKCLSADATLECPDCTVQICNKCANSTNRIFHCPDCLPPEMMDIEDN